MSNHDRYGWEQYKADMEQSAKRYEAKYGINVKPTRPKQLPRLKSSSKGKKATRVFAVIAIALVLSLIAGAVYADEVCYEKADLVGLLHSTKGEYHIVSAQADNGLTIDTYVSDKGTWTQVVEKSKDVHCILVSGTHFQMLIKDK